MAKRTSLTVAGTAELGKVLQQHKAGEIQLPEAVDKIENLFRREPVNYSRVYSDEPTEPKGPQA